MKELKYLKLDFRVGTQAWREYPQTLEMVQDKILKIRVPQTTK